MRRVDDLSWEELRDIVKDMQRALFGEDLDGGREFDVDDLDVMAEILTEADLRPPAHDDDGEEA